MKCQNCGEEIREGAIFCGKCGHRVVPVIKKICPACGYERKPGERYCSQCGTILDDVDGPDPTQQIRVQINGYPQIAIEIPVDASETVAITCARANQKVIELLSGRQVIGQEYEPGQYINFKVKEVTPPPVPPKPQTEKAGGPAKDALLLDLSVMSYYEGETKVGVAKATGILRVYDDRLEMKKTFGSNWAAAFGVVGMAVAAKKAQKDPYVKWYFRDMSSVWVGRYNGVYHSIVIEMKNGQKHTFVSSSPAPNKIDNAVDLIGGLLKDYK